GAVARAVLSACCLGLVFVLCRALCVFSSMATATTDISTLSLHDALPISKKEIMAASAATSFSFFAIPIATPTANMIGRLSKIMRSEEHTSELQSRFDLVCRLLLEKKKKKT